MNALEKYSERNKAIIPEKTIVPINIQREPKFNSKSFPIATAVPDLPFPITYNEIKFSPVTKVPIIPTSRIKVFSFILKKELPRTAAWDAPSPGRKEQSGEERTEDFIALIVSFISNFSYSNPCLGRDLFSFMLVRRIDIPKRPVSRGNNGSLIIVKSKVNTPKTPDRMKTINAINHFSFPS